MLGFVQNWFAPKGNPIGVDFGSETLRLAQVQLEQGQWRLVAAAMADIPPQIRHDPAGRIEFFVDSVREMLSSGVFLGRRAVLALPAASMFFQHLRLPRMDDEAIRKALPWEARGKLPIDPSHAVLRHLIAGEVFNDQDPKNEVIVMAAHRELVNQYLAMAARARIEVVGMDVEPKALLDGFAHLRTNKDAEVTNCFVDIGAAGTRAVITRGAQVLFARAVPIGGDHFSRAVAAAMKISLADAKLLRIRHAAGPTREAAPAEATHPPAGTPAATSAPSEDSSFALLSAAIQRSGGEAAVPEQQPQPTQPVQPVQPSAESADDQSTELLHAIREPLGKLIDELRLCRRYHESTFPNRPVERLVFVGGEAASRGLCQSIARQMGLAAQIGDPLARIVREREAELPFDLRQPQPAWSVAIGLSLGYGQASIYSDTAVAASAQRNTD